MKIKYVIHPFLFAIVPILFYYGNNFDISNFSEILFPGLINLGIIALVLIISYIFSKNWQQAGIEATLIIFIYSTFGHVLFLALHNGFFLDDINPLIISYMIFFIIFSWVNFRVVKNHLPITEFLNIAGIVLLTFSIINILPEWLEKDTIIKLPPITEIPPPSNLPDIYYIILDGYGGNEMLSEVYKFDNSPFITQLEEKGFYIASASFTNYLRTVQSLNSTLNIHYIENDSNWDTNIKFIHNNYVQEQLKHFGYTIYTIPNQFQTTNWTGGSTISQKAIGTKFFWEYLSTTVAILFWDSVPYDFHRLDILYQFKSIENVVEKEGPKFVFAHIIAPHPPFVFDKNGNAIQNNRLFETVDANDLGLPVKEYQSQYLEQLQFINTKTIETIETILEKSKESPIIILQGDHGPGSMLDSYNFENNSCLYERFSILNAYYLPENNNNLYDDISPINSFRLIFNDYFGLPLDMLEDKAFYSPNTDYNDKSEVTHVIKSKICYLDP